MTDLTPAEACLTQDHVGPLTWFRLVRHCLPGAPYRKVSALYRQRLTVKGAISRLGPSDQGQLDAQIWAVLSEEQRHRWRSVRDYVITGKPNTQERDTP